MDLVYKYKSNMYTRLFKRSPGGAWLSSIRVWYVWLSPRTNETLKFILQKISINNFKINWLSMKYWTKVRTMSSRYAPYRLGYPYDTMVVTKRNLELILSWSEKLPKFELQSATWLHEIGIASNRFS